MRVVMRLSLTYGRGNIVTRLQNSARRTQGGAELGRTHRGVQAAQVLFGDSRTGGFNRLTSTNKALVLLRSESIGHKYVCKGHES
jgi:hypothetical protein